MAADANPNLLLRYGTLLILVLQTTATVLLLRYSRTRPGRPYLASTAVLLNECVKFLMCSFSLYAQRGFSLGRSWRAFKEEILGKPGETVKLIVPSGLYCLQNNLLFIALTNLDAATYQVHDKLNLLLAMMTIMIFSGDVSAQDFDDCHLFCDATQEKYSFSAMAGIAHLDDWRGLSSSMAYGLSNYGKNIS